MSPSGRLIVALDFTGLAPALRMARRLRGLVRAVKVGSALFTAAGPEAVARLRALGFEVMLDLKFFDIPNTVELSCRAAGRLGATRLTVHAAGGEEMLRAAVAGARAGARGRSAAPKVLAVTVLTSAPAGRSRVVELARTALASGCGGVVASAQEAEALRRALPRRAEIVCPGIRPASASSGDQRRIATPARALANGADLLVVGRPILEAANPARAARNILQEMEDAHAC